MSTPESKEIKQEIKQEIDSNATTSVDDVLDIKPLKVGIISGGQTGADQSGILAAITYKGEKLYVGGYAANGFWTEKGVNLRLKEWGLLSYPTRGYDKRDMANVDLADMVIAFKLNIPRTGRGATKTYNYALIGKYTDTFIDGTAHLHSYNSSRPVVDLTLEKKDQKLLPTTTLQPLSSIVTLKRKFDSNSSSNSSSNNDSHSVNSPRVGSKPVLLIWNAHIHPQRAEFPQQIANFIRKYAPQIITSKMQNSRCDILISGPCESTMPGIQLCIQKLLSAGLELANVV